MLMALVCWSYLQHQVTCHTISAILLRRFECLIVLCHPITEWIQWESVLLRMLLLIWIVSVTMGWSERNKSNHQLVLTPQILVKNDVIGLIECLDESVKKSRREAVAMCSTELFFLSMTFFKRFLTQDARNFAMVEKVDGRRIKVQLLSFDFASKFPKLLKSLPKDAALLSNY